MHSLEVEAALHVCQSVYHLHGNGLIEQVLAHIPRVQNPQATEPVSRMLVSQTFPEKNGVAKRFLVFRSDPFLIEV